VIWDEPQVARPSLIVLLEAQLHRVLLATASRSGSRQEYLDARKTILRAWHYVDDSASSNQKRGTDPR